MINFNGLIYESGPIKVSDFLSETPNLIHQKMYKDALNKFYKDYPQYKDNSSIEIIEIKNDEYWKYSKIIVFDHSNNPVIRKQYSLEKYWNNIFINKDNYNENIISIHDQIDYIDYIHGKAHLVNRQTGNVSIIDINNLNKDVELTDNFNVYPNTFNFKYKLLNSR